MCSGCRSCRSTVTALLVLVAAAVAPMIPFLASTIPLTDILKDLAGFSFSESREIPVVRTRLCCAGRRVR